MALWFGLGLLLLLLLCWWCVPADRHASGWFPREENYAGALGFAVTPATDYREP